MKAFPPASRRLLVLAALGAAASVWGQEAPTAGAPAGQNAVPAATPAPADAPAPSVPDVTATAAAPIASAPAPSDHILPAADPSAPAASTLGGVLSGNSTAVSTIQRQELPQRDRLLGELSERVQLADRKIAELQQKGSELDDQGKKSLDTALAEYNRTKTNLQQSLENSRSAELNTWERTRSHLASDYAFFVAAAAAVELISPN